LFGVFFWLSSENKCILQGTFGHSWGWSFCIPNVVVVAVVVVVFFCCCCCNPHGYGKNKERKNSLAC
jgi:hypothetical protein